MPLPNSYTQKTGAIPAYFDSMLNAEPPERFTYKFLSQLEFKSTNDRLFVGILKDLAFIDADGVPKERYFEFLDRSRSGQVLAEGIREAYSDLFAVNKAANEMTVTDVKNKLRTLYAGAKKDTVIDKIAKTFKALCDYADFSLPHAKLDSKSAGKESENKKTETKESGLGDGMKKEARGQGMSLGSLQYHINIVLPKTSDQAVYDAIFKSLRDHLGHPDE